MLIVIIPTNNNIIKATIPTNRNFLGKNRKLAALILNNALRDPKIKPIAQPNLIIEDNYRLEKSDIAVLLEIGTNLQIPELKNTIANAVKEYYEK